MLKKIILAFMILCSLMLTSAIASSDPYDEDSTEPQLPPTSVDPQLPSPYYY